MLQLGTLEQAADVYFELQEAISKLATASLADRADSGRPLQVEDVSLEGLLAGVAGLSDAAAAVGAALEAAGLGLPALLALAASGDEELRPRLKACGVKKIGQREALIATLEDAGQPYRVSWYGLAGCIRFSL